jgi:ribonuclease Y
MNNTILMIILPLVGIGVGYYIRMMISMSKRGSLELELKESFIKAKEEAQKITDKSKKQAEEEEKERHVEFKKTEDRLIKKEDLLDNRQSDIDKEVESLKNKAAELITIKEKLSQQEEIKKAELEKVSGLSTEDAKDILIKQTEKEYEDDFLIRSKKLEQVGVEKLERRAQDILATSIQRLATSTASEFMTTTVSIQSDDVKGKVIGKEGRNIRAFERAAGVELMVDDTPGMITISSYDPVRRQVARVALENLILDGRVQPAKIEELVQKAKDDINKIIKQKGEEAVYEVGIYNLDPRIVAILGRLYFRTSYGQNVLNHSVEMAHIAGMIAEELGADVEIAKASALVHDIGKALDHEVQGTHVDIGMRILQKFGADERIITAMKSHHEDYPYETVEAVIVQTADAISGGRPGARRDSVENYIKRLKELEAVSSSFEGVEKAYAIAAGREIRVFINPDKISDLEAKKLARDVANKIEQDLKYPGEIKIVVIRENRIIEFAR